MIEDKQDSSQYSEIYTELVNRLILLPEHREQLHAKRGFNDELIDKLQFRSCSPDVQTSILSLTQNLSTRELRQAGILINDEPNPKLLKDNILIPFIENGKVVAIRPHKSALAGFS